LAISASPRRPAARLGCIAGSGARRGDCSHLFQRERTRYPLAAARSHSRSGRIRRTGLCPLLTRMSLSNMWRSTLYHIHDGTDPLPAPPTRPLARNAATVAFCMALMSFRTRLLAFPSARCRSTTAASNGMPSSRALCAKAMELAILTMAAPASWHQIRQRLSDIG
jgi:hypothetical protein